MRNTLSDETIYYVKDGIASPEMSYAQFAEADIDLLEVSCVVKKYYVTREEAGEMQKLHKVT